MALAEDDDAMRGLVASDLERAGFSVLELRDGTELSAYIRAATLRSPALQRAHALVTDVRMPGCDGLDALELLRSLGWELPTVVVTAFGDRQTHERAAHLGACAVLDKPFDLRELRAALHDVLEPSTSELTMPPPHSCVDQEP